LGQPADVTVVAGEVVTLQVEVAGNGPFAFQWFAGEAGYEGTPIEGETESFLTVVAETNGSYWVRVTDAAGETINSTSAKVTLIEETQPEPQPDPLPQPELPTITGQAFTLARTAKAMNLLVGIISGAVAHETGISVKAPQGLRVSDVRIEGQGIYACVYAHAALAEGEYMLLFTLNREDGIEISFEVQAVITANTAPTLAEIAEQSMEMDAKRWVSVYAQDEEQSFKQLAWTIAIDNAALVDVDAGFYFNAAEQGLLVMPRAGHVGRARITITVTDAGGLAASTEFVLHVGDPAGALGISPLEDQMLMADGTSYTFDINVLNIDADADFEPRAYALDDSILPVIEVQGMPGAITLTMAATAGVTGQTTVIVIVSNGFVTASMAFRVTVADGMILSASASAAQGQTADDFDGGCTAGAGGGLAALALAALPVISRRRRK
jgi:hypothetical protein